MTLDKEEPSFLRRKGESQYRLFAEAESVTKPVVSDQGAFTLGFVTLGSFLIASVPLIDARIDVRVVIGRLELL